MTGSKPVLHLLKALLVQMKGSVRRADPKQQNGALPVKRLKVNLFSLKRPCGGNVGHRSGL